MTLTFGSLFAGIGGLDLGLERAGLECQWQVENDPYCIRVLAKHWPDIPRYGDVRELSGSTLETVDVICGGFPCQPVSTAGKQQAQADPRWLWPHFARLVDELSPRYVIVENVPGLWTTTGGSEVISDLAALGYDIRWDHIFAITVGAPHLRERVFIVAYPNRGGQVKPRVYEEGGESVLQFAGSDWSSEGSGRTSSTENKTMADSSGSGPQRQWTQRGLRKDQSQIQTAGSDWWVSEPQVDRVAHGIPSRVDRLRVLGNAVVPQVAETIGRWLVDLNE